MALLIVIDMSNVKIPKRYVCHFKAPLRNTIVDLEY